MSGVRLAIRVLCLLVVLSAIALQCCQARGARGGGFRGGSRWSRGSSRSSSSRSISRSFRSSSLRRGTSPYTRSNWKYYAGIGMIYGSSRYLRSRRYHDHPDEMPTVCSNQYDKSPNGTVYGYFICPKDGEEDNMNYCCGEDNKEYCCRFGDSPGRVAGIVVGCLIGVAVIAFIVYMVFRHCYGKKGKRCTGAAASSVHYQVSHASNTGPAPFSTTLSKQQPDSFGSGKDPLPPGDVSSAWGTPPYPPPYSSPQYSDPPAYPPVPNGPPDGPPTGPTGAYPSQPPPAYGFTQ